MPGIASNSKERRQIPVGLSLPVSAGRDAMLRLVNEYRKQKYFTKGRFIHIAETCNENPTMLLIMYKYEEDMIKDEYPELAKFYPFE